MAETVFIDLPKSIKDYAEILVKEGNKKRTVLTGSVQKALGVSTFDVIVPYANDINFLYPVRVIGIQATITIINGGTPRRALAGLISLTYNSSTPVLEVVDAVRTINPPTIENYNTLRIAVLPMVSFYDCKDIPNKFDASLPLTLEMGFFENTAIGDVAEYRWMVIFEAL